MTLDAFVRDREPSWRELDALLDRARGRPERLGPDGVRRLGALYRAAAADLAFARRRFAQDPVVARIERLVMRARQAVYEAETRRGSVRGFFGRGYWRLVRERPAALAVAAALLLAPEVATALWALGDPAAAIGLVPEQFQPATEPEGGSSGLSGDEQAAFSSAVLTNNVRVSLFTFVGGITAGIVTAWVLVFNGVVIGAVAGLALEAGRGEELVELVAAHGVLEISCIIVAAAAGLRFGWALVDPGRRRRREAVVVEARRAVQVALGTAPWLGLAALVEGMVRSGQIAGVGPGLAVGFGLGGLYWALVVWRGRPEPEDDEHAPASRRRRAPAAPAPRGGGVTAAPVPSP